MDHKSRYITCQIPSSSRNNLLKDLGQLVSATILGRRSTIDHMNSKLGSSPLGTWRESTYSWSDGQYNPINETSLNF